MFLFGREIERKKSHTYTWSGAMHCLESHSSVTVNVLRCFNSIKIAQLISYCDIMPAEWYFLLPHIEFMVCFKSALHLNASFWISLIVCHFHSNKLNRIYQLYMSPITRYDMLSKLSICNSFGMVIDSKIWYHCY